MKSLGIFKRQKASTNGRGCRAMHPVAQINRLAPPQNIKVSMISAHVRGALTR
jgi:hypothetical protein